MEYQKKEDKQQAITITLVQVYDYFLESISKKEEIVF